ncbi:MAG: hypothetical protein Tsb009_36750 [Planctomycetaceae bacterium]
MTGLQIAGEKSQRKNVAGVAAATTLPAWHPGGKNPTKNEQNWAPEAQNRIQMHTLTAGVHAQCAVHVPNLDAVA